MILFKRIGTENTEETLKLSLEAIRKHNIRHIVLASNTGATAFCLLKLAEEMPIAARPQITVVTHVCDFKPGTDNELSSGDREKLINQGCKVVTAAHILSGVERCFSRKFGGLGPAEIVAHTLRMFGQGTKVALEISLMARDAGAIPGGQVILAIGGSGRGADTALTLTPGTSSALLDTKIHEFICKPGLVQE